MKKDEIKRVIFNVINTILILLISFLLCVNVFLSISKVVYHNDLPKVFGYASAVVLSGSMSPTFDVGDMVIIKQTDDYDVGDIVTFRQQALITHRIVQENENGFITKGDNPVNSADDEISASQIEGEVVAVIPYIGYAMNIFNSPLGLIIIMLSLIVIIEITYFVKYVKISNEDD